METFYAITEQPLIISCREEVVVLFLLQNNGGFMENWLDAVSVLSIILGKKWSMNNVV